MQLRAQQGGSASYGSHLLTRGIFVAFAGHAHVHDEFSPLDGTGNRNQLTREAVKNGQTHLGCTNHGRLGSVLDHIHACRHPEEFDDPDDPGRKRSKDERLIPWVGIEAFWRPDRFMDLSNRDLYGKNGHNWAQHLCLHAGSLAGWRTLMRLSSKSWQLRDQGGGFYGKACMDPAMLRDDHEGIIVSTACLSSPVSWFALKGDETGARQWLLDILDIVGPDNLFLEIMPHDLEPQRQLNLAKIQLANDLGLPLMVTGDVHIPYKSWMTTQSIVRMASYRTTISKQDKKKDAGEEIYTTEIDTIYLSGEDDLKQMFASHHPDIPETIVQEALDNTQEFAKRFKMFVVGKTLKMPKVSKSPLQGEMKLRRWCVEGLKRIGKHDDKTYVERYEHELNVLKGKKVIDFFLIVGDFVRWAKSDLPLPGDERVFRGKRKRPIRVGLGRGSAAGCLISYLVGITAVDPIAWGLLFERFLNEDRVGMPDIDIDFETEVPVTPYELDGRDMVIEYIKRTYGADHVAAIIAYQTFAPRAVIKAVSDTQDISYIETKKVTDSLGDTDRDLAKLVLDNDVLTKFSEEHPEVWEHCLRLEDQILRDSRHAGGIVITDKPVTHYMPTQIGADEKSVVTAFADRVEFPIISDYGFLKNDILGVKGLSKQEIACQLIATHYEEEFEPNDLPALRDPWATDQKVIDGFVHGMTVGVFQFGSRGITQLLRHIKPDSAMDISVANALYRPGPIKIAFEYGDRKNGKTPVTYWHDSLEPILGQTLGLMCFQEQAMDVVKHLAGFTGGEADNFRKIMSKLYRLPGDKAQQVMQKDHDKFIHGCMTLSGLKEQEAEFIWTERMLPLGDYLFNKSHSSGYGLQAYQDMHIKIFYPLAFYAADLTVTKKQKKEETIDYYKRVMREATIFDVKIVQPDVNDSDFNWTIGSVRNREIRYGITSIAGMGSAAANDVIAHRPYDDLNDFIDRVPSGFGTDAIYSLAKAGAFDRFVERRHALSRTRKWPEHKTRLAIEMTCGCKKGRSVGVLPEEFDSDPNSLDGAVDQALAEISCKRHPEAEIQAWEELDPYYPLTSWMKEHPGQDPNGLEVEIPEQAEILKLEEQSLNLPLSLQSVISEYKNEIEARIFTEEEVDALPSKPNRNKAKQHGSFCGCDACEAARCVIGGEVTSKKEIKTKNGDKMAFIDVAFGVNQWSVTLFPFIYERCHHLLTRPTVLLIAGHKQTRKDQSQILAFDVQDVMELLESEVAA
jgi:DNA polymerase-3 subunit alpha